MKKVIIIFVFQFLVLTIFGAEPQTIQEIFAKIQTNQPNMEDVRHQMKSKSKEECEQLKAKFNTYDRENKILKNKLIGMSKTDSSVKDSIIEEILKYSSKNIERNYYSVCYQVTLLEALHKINIYSVFKCANTIINSDEYEGGSMFEDKLHGYWLRGKLTAEQVRPIFIKLATGEHKNKDAVQVLLGSKYYKPLDKETGEQIVRRWIEEETNVEDKLQYYRILDSVGIKDPEYVNILKSIIDNPDMPLLSKPIYAKQLEWIGATNNPIIKEEVNNIKSDYKQMMIERTNTGIRALIRISPDQPITNAEGRIYHIVK